MINTILNLIENAVGFGIRNRNRLVVRAEEPGDLWCVLDQVVGFVCQVGAHHYVAGEELALAVDLAAAAHFHHFFSWNNDLFKQMGQALLLCLFLDGFGDLLLKIRIRVDDIPT